MIQLKLSEKTEKRLKKFMSLHKDNDLFFERILNAQLDEIKRGMLAIKQDMEKFEEKYQMKTQTFYEKFSKGELGDEDDFIIWSGIYEMYLRDKETLGKIEF